MLTPKDPLVSIVVVVHNRPQLTHQTLATLKSTLEKSSINTEVIVVNNQSDQPTVEVLQKFPEFTTLHPDTNGGCAFGKNLAIKHAKGPYYYLSDNDMYFLDGWLETNLKAMQIFSDFHIIGSFRHPFHGVIHTHTKQGITVEESDMQVGSSWLLTKQTWADFGPLDETVPTGRDDALFCTAVRSQGGKVGAIKPNLVVHCGATDTTGSNSPGGDQWSQDPDYYQRLPKGALIK